MIALLIAQLAGPPCGYHLGGWVSPQSAPFTGCTLTNGAGRPTVNLRLDPFSPSGVRAEPLPPQTLPVFTPATVIQGR